MLVWRHFGKSIVFYLSFDRAICLFYFDNIRDQKVTQLNTTLVDVVPDEHCLNLSLSYWVLSPEKFLFGDRDSNMILFSSKKLHHLLLVQFSNNPDGLFSWLLDDRVKTRLS